MAGTPRAACIVQGALGASPPSPMPSPSPSERPSLAPSPTPTEVPTTKPPTTDRPSFSPTRTPTELPTPVPSPTPTEAPTPSPTLQPSRAPTTAQPSVSALPATPTEMPSMLQSRAPTLQRTAEPARAATQIPSAGALAAVQSSSPTLKPSDALTKAPSHVPSLRSPCNNQMECGVGMECYMAGTPHATCVVQGELGSASALRPPAPSVTPLDEAAKQDVPDAARAPTLQPAESEVSFSFHGLPDTRANPSWGFLLLAGTAPHRPAWVAVFLFMFLCLLCVCLCACGTLNGCRSVRISDACR